MRAAIFRTLAGLVAAGAAWMFVVDDLKGWGVQRIVGHALMAAVFAVYALIGDRPAEWMLTFWLGSPVARKPQQKDIDADQSN